MTGSALLNKPARSARRRALSSLAAAAMLLSRRWIELRARGLRVTFGLEIGPGACWASAGSYVYRSKRPQAPGARRQRPSRTI